MFRKRELVKIDKEKIEHAKFQAKKTKNSKSESFEDYRDFGEIAFCFSKRTMIDVIIEENVYFITSCIFYILGLN